MRPRWCNIGFSLPRFYPIVDAGAAACHGCSPVLLAECLLEAGARILQFRHKGLFTAAALSDAGAIASLCRDAGAHFIVNDRADIAALLGAGVHLGQDDLPPAAARRLLGSAIIGFSTHNRAQLEAAAREDVEYVALGPIFATASKADPDPVVGTEQLRALRSLAPRPLAVIGGITLSNARSALEAGADSVAVIAGLFPETAHPAALRRRAAQWLAAVEAV